MDSVLAVYKNKGETPLQALDRLRVEKPEYAKEKMTYAGRLDPLAEGLLLVLTGEACKDKEKYSGLDKTYITEMLCGISTDTHDLLGLVTEIKFAEIEEGKFTEAVNFFAGEFSQKYPAYSSKTIGGVQLHELSRKKEQFEFPEHKVSLYDSKIISRKKIRAEDVLSSALISAGLVSGDFRQEEIKNRWKSVLGDKKNQFDLFELELSVSSGFYVRQFAFDIGEKLGCPALAYSIKRTKVGEWTT